MSFIYDLVQACCPKLYPQRVPHAIATRMSHIYSGSVVLTVEEGDTASFFLQDLGLALVAKTCPRRPQAFNKVNNGLLTFFLNEPIAGTPRHACKTFHTSVRRYECRPNIKSYLTPKVDPIVTLNNKVNYANLHTFPHKTPNVLAIFKR